MTKATGTAVSINVSVARYSFLPRFSRSDGSGACSLDWTYYTQTETDTGSRLRVGGPTTAECLLSWDYITSSDNPSVWVVTRDSDGAVIGIAEAEDPPPGGTAALSAPVDEDGNELAGYTVINVGLPSLTVIEAMYAAMPVAERVAAMSCTGAYVEGGAG